MARSGTRYGAKTLAQTSSQRPSEPRTKAIPPPSYTSMTTTLRGKNKKSDGLYNLVKQLKAEDVPIHGVGFQGHFIAGQVPKDFAANMKRFVDLGLEAAVTELDVRIKKPVTAQSRQQQAEDYAQAVTDCLSVRNCVGVTVWDFADKYTYIQNDPEWAEPALWDINMKPKEAVSAVEKFLDN